MEALWPVLWLLALMVSAGSAQELAPPGFIKLLPGYHHRSTQGIDSKTGYFAREGGLKIQYDIGELAGNYAECVECGWTQGEVWRKKQVINGREVVCVFTAKKRLIVSFPQAHANFYATVRSPDDVTDMLLMVFTFAGE